MKKVIVTSTLGILYSWLGALLTYALILLFAGCNPPNPIEPKIVTVSAPAMNDYRPYLAVAIAEETEANPVVPIPPAPAPDVKVKIGDVCPVCGGDGVMDGDSVVKPKCVQCEGDGKVDAGDPILLVADWLGLHGETVKGEHSVLAEQADIVATLTKVNAAVVRAEKLIDDSNKFLSQARTKTAEKSSSLFDKLITDNPGFFPQERQPQAEEDASMNPEYYIVYQGVELVYHPEKKQFISQSGMVIDYPSGKLDGIKRIVLAGTKFPIPLQSR